MIESDQAETPKALWDMLDRKYVFGRDLAASSRNAKCMAHFTLEDSALKHRWTVQMVDGQPVKYQLWDWCNPPYSRGNLDAFTAKAREEVAMGWAGVLLIPATPGAQWFQRHVLHGHDVLSGESVNPASESLLQGWELRLGGNGYQLRVRFLMRRVKFFNPFRPDVKDGAKTDSCLIEYRPRRLL